MARTELFGKHQPGGMFSVINQGMTTGDIFFVSSATGTDGVSNGQSPDTPTATLDYAIGLCAANHGDRIYVMPGHTETIATAAAVALDVAGVEVIGIGSGAARPKMNFTAVGSTFAISTANCTVKNLLFTGGIDAVVSPIVVTAADVKLIDCEYRDVTGQCTDGILATAADRLLIQNYRHDGDVAAGTNAAIALVNCDGVVIDGARFDGNFAVGVVDLRTTASTDLEVRNVMARNRNASCIFLIDTITASTGMIGPNINIRTLTNGANITETITGATLVLFDPIYVVNNANEKAMLINWVASTDA